MRPVPQIFRELHPSQWHTVYPFLPRRQVNLLLTDGVRQFRESKKKAVNETPLEHNTFWVLPPQRGRDFINDSLVQVPRQTSDQSVSTRINTCQYPFKKYGCWCSHEAVVFSTLKGKAYNGANPLHTNTAEDCSCGIAKQLGVYPQQSPCVLMCHYVIMDLNSPLQSLQGTMQLPFLTHLSVGLFSPVAFLQ